MNSTFSLLDELIGFIVWFHAVCERKRELGVGAEFPIGKSQWTPSGGDFKNDNDLEESAATSVRLEGGNAHHGHVIQVEGTGVDLDVAGQQSGKVLDVAVSHFITNQDIIYFDLI